MSAAAGAVMIAALVLVIAPGRTSPVTQIGTVSDPQGFTPEYVAFSPDGKTIAASFDDEVSSEVSSDILTWTPGSGRPPARLAWTMGTSVDGLAFSPANANVLAYADSEIEVWNVARHTQAAYEAPGGAAPNTAQFAGFASTRAGKAIAEVDPGGSVYLLDTANGKWLVRHFAPAAPAESVSDPADEIFLGPDGQTVAVLDGAKNVYVWNLSGVDDKPSVIKGAGGAVFSPDGKTLAVAYPGRIRLWDVTARTFSSVQLPGPGPRDGNNPVPNAMAFSANGAALAVAYGYDDAGGNGDAGGAGTVYLWNLAARTAVTFSAPAASRGGLALSPDGGTLALAGDTGGGPGGSVFVYRIGRSR